MGGVEFIVDENLVRLGRALALLRGGDVSVFGDPGVADFAPLGALDSHWIEPVAERGLVVITDDGGLRTRPAESQQCVEHGAKIIHLYKIGDRRPWDQFLRLTSRWGLIEKHMTDHPDGPWWLSVRSQSVKALPFAPGEVER